MLFLSLRCDGAVGKEARMYGILNLYERKIINKSCNIDTILQQLPCHIVSNPQGWVGVNQPETWRIIT